MYQLRFSLMLSVQRNLLDTLVLIHKFLYLLFPISVQLPFHIIQVMLDMNHAMRKRDLGYALTAKADVQSDPGIYCLLTESFGIKECMNGEQRPRIYFMHVQDDLTVHFAHVRRHFFAGCGQYSDVYATIPIVHSIQSV